MRYYHASPRDVSCRPRRVKIRALLRTRRNFTEKALGPEPEWIVACRTGHSTNLEGSTCAIPRHVGLPGYTSYAYYLPRLWGIPAAKPKVWLAVPSGTRTRDTAGKLSQDPRLPLTWTAPTLMQRDEGDYTFSRAS